MASETERCIVNYAHMILAFPLSVISTNRILNTALSRSGRSNSLNPIDLWRDFIALKRFGGHRTLYAGLVPTLLYYIIPKLYENKKSDVTDINNLSSRTATARIALKEHFGMTKVKPGTDLSQWHDIDGFKRSDAKRAETDWTPWYKRHFPALYRCIYTHEGRVDKQLGEAMLTTGVDDDDKFMRHMLNERFTSGQLREWEAYIGSFAIIGFMNILVAR